MGLKDESDDDEQLYNRKITDESSLRSIDRTAEHQKELAYINGEIAIKQAAAKPASGSSSSSSSKKTSGTSVSSKKTRSTKDNGPSGTVRSIDRPSNQHGTFSVKVKEEYDKAVKNSIIDNQNSFLLDSYDNEDAKNVLHENFKEQCNLICTDKRVLCNIIVDLCYSNNKSKQFAWELCGDIIINNLLRHRGYKLSFPKQSEDGDFTYKGLTFKMEEVIYETDSK